MDRPEGTGRARPVGLVFLLAINVYFAAQIALRLTLGGALETDEAEMMVMTPGLQLGYGPQLPLYNWIQIELFELFGRGLFALSLMKNGLLWLSYLMVFLGLRLWLPAGVAAMGALSLFLVPDIAWEAQRATTHSNILLAASALTIAAFLWAMRGGRWGAWIALGLAVGIGGLSKYNYWMVPLGLFLAALTVAPMRVQMLRRRVLIVPVLAAAIVALPYVWMIRNADLAFASLGKLQLEEHGAAGGPPEGLALTGQGALALLALPLLVLALLWTLGRRKPEGAGPGVAALLIRAGLVLWGLVAAAVWLADVGHMTQRWLLPISTLTVPGLFVWGHRRLAPRGVGAFRVALAVLAVLVFAGLVYDRYKPGARRDVDFTALPATLAEIAPLPQTPVVAEFYTAGNLARLEPGWRIAPYLPFVASDYGGGEVLFLFREDVPPNLATGLGRAGWGAADLDILAEGDLSLPYLSSEDRLPMHYVLAVTPVLERRK